jgi:hypothetical protein
MRATGGEDLVPPMRRKDLEDAHKVGIGHDDE